MSCPCEAVPRPICGEDLNLLPDTATDNVTFSVICPDIGNWRINFRKIARFRIWKC